jgi:hypothetical protein
MMMMSKETIKGINLIENLKNILSAARSSGIKVVYILPKKGTLQTEKTCNSYENEIN